MRRRPRVRGSKLRILCLHTATQPPLGADTWVHLQIIKQLDRERHELILACARGGHDAPTPTYRAAVDIDDIEIVHVSLGVEMASFEGRTRVVGYLRSLVAIPNVIRLAFLCRRRRVDIVSTSDRPRDAATAVVLGWVSGAISVVHVHVLYSEYMGRLLCWALGRADHLVAISRFVADSLAPLERAPDSVHVVHNAIEPARWVPDPAARTRVRAELGVPEAAPFVVSVSRLFPAKGTSELIRAVAAVRHRCPEVRLAIAGTDVTQDSQFSAELEQLIAELDLADTVRFLGRREDVPALMAAADVYAMPSFEEPFGLVFLEALATEVPVVALANGGTLEVVEHEVSGLLSEPGDLVGLSDNLYRVLADASLRRRLGRAGREAVEERFTTRRQAAGVADVYARALDDR